MGPSPGARWTAGAVPTALQAAGWTPLGAQRTLVWAFASIGIMLIGCYLLLSRAVEVPRRRTTASGSPRPGLHRSRGVVFRLSALFGLDALAGGFVVQSLIAFWFHQRFGVGLDRLGPLFFGTNCSRRSRAWWPPVSPIGSGC